MIFLLTLVTTDAYLNQISISFADYHQLYNKSYLKFQQITPQLPLYDRALYSTRSLSLEHSNPRICFRQSSFSCERTLHWLRAVTPT
jgi:hypothetical protein